MSTAKELTHTLVRDGVYDFYYTDLDTTFLQADDGRAASIAQDERGFFVTRSYGPTPRVLRGSFREALEHLSIG